MREAQPHLGLAAQFGVCEKTRPSRGQSWSSREAGLPGSGRWERGVLGGYRGNIKVALGFPETEGAKLEGLGAAAQAWLLLVSPYSYSFLPGQVTASFQDGLWALLT